MKREIKFRAFDGNRMRDVFKIVYHIGVETYIYFTDTQSSEPGHLSVSDDRLHLMQFTGLKEHCNDDPAKNKEIYEGDIIMFSDGEKLAVEWNDDTCQWQYSDGSPLNSGERYGVYKMIIGNRFSHPHLLTPQQSKIV